MTLRKEIEGSKKMKLKCKCVCCSNEKWVDEELCGEMVMCDKCFSPCTVQEVKHG